MSKVELAIPPERLDKRVLAKPFLASAVSKEQIEAHLQALPDLVSNAAALETVLDAIDKRQESKNQEENLSC